MYAGGSHDDESLEPCHTFHVSMTSLFLITCSMHMQAITPLHGLINKHITSMRFRATLKIILLLQSMIQGSNAGESNKYGAA